MITCRGLNMAKHLIVELEAVLLEKGKSSKDLVRATGHTTVNVSRTVSYTHLDVYKRQAWRRTTTTT